MWSIHNILSVLSTYGAQAFPAQYYTCRENEWFPIQDCRNEEIVITLHVVTI